MNKKQIKAAHSIEMSNFLRCYLEIDNEELISLFSKMTHKQLKVIAMDYGIRLSKVGFNEVEIEDINMGVILLVNDYYGNPAPYVNPLNYQNFMDGFYDMENYGRNDKNDKHQRR